MKPPLTPMARLRYDRIRLLMPPDAATMVEIGCGEGAVGYRLAQRYRYVGLEPDEQSCRVAQARIGQGGDIRRGDVSTLADATFDVVCAFEVLEHIEDDRAALRSWLEHVRPGGHLVISVPAYAARFGTSDEAVGHYRRYEPDALLALLEAVGLGEIRMVLYGAPLGYALENVRNRVLARRATSGSQQERTAASGRLLQPRSSVVATAVAMGVAPFTYLQRAFPARGVGIVARGRRAGTSAAGSAR
jgi:SAM-dependent methyltransferase